jgi:hypothetical protein
MVPRAVGSSRETISPSSEAWARTLPGKNGARPDDNARFLYRSRQIGNVDSPGPDD